MHALPSNVLSQPAACCMLQADFIVPSSREAVDCDSAWNELLRDQVPNLFLQALHSFKGLTPPHADQPMAWVNRWLQSIPLPREVQLSPPLSPQYAHMASLHTHPPLSRGLMHQLTTHNLHDMGFHWQDLHNAGVRNRNQLIAAAGQWYLQIGYGLSQSAGNKAYSSWC